MFWWCIFGIWNEKIIWTAWNSHHCRINRRLHSFDEFTYQCVNFSQMNEYLAIFKFIWFGWMILYTNFRFIYMWTVNTKTCVCGERGFSISYCGRLYVESISKTCWNDCFVDCIIIIELMDFKIILLHAQWTVHSAQFPMYFWHDSIHLHFFKSKLKSSLKMSIEWIRLIQTRFIINAQ